MTKKIRRQITQPASSKSLNTKHNATKRNARGGGEQPFLSLCVIFRDNADTIKALLDSVAGCFDEYVFVDTGSKDGTRAVVADFLQTQNNLLGLTGVLADFEWVDDFAAARQRSFDLATGRWRMFLDTDDVLAGGKVLRPLLEAVEAEAPQTAGFFVPYAYAFDEDLHTMRVARYGPARVQPGTAPPLPPTPADADLAWKWVDAIHERLEPTSEVSRDRYRQMDPKQVRVLHKQKTPEQKRAAIDRNEVIALREYPKAKAAGDKRYAARLARTIAMAHKAHGRIDDAIPFLEELYEEYLTYPEGRQAAADLCHAYVAKAMAKATPENKIVDQHFLDMALVWARRAGPSYEAVVRHVQYEPRPYGDKYPPNLSTAQFFAWQAGEECIRAAQRGQGIEQQATHEGAVVEKAGAFLAAADCILKEGGPRAAERVEHIMNGIHPRWRTHPLVRDFAQRLRNEIDRITILVPGTPQPFDETGGGGMLGGSEEAVMYLSRALAEQGRKVRIYAPLPFHRLPGLDQYGVDWQPWSSYNPDHEAGTLVVWRALGFVRALAEARSNRNVDFPGICKSFLWLHDIHLPFSPEDNRVLTGLMEGTIVLSEFHRYNIEQQGAVKTIKLSNGITEADFEGDIGKWDKDPMSVVYSSCPSRGLMKLLDMWPRVRSAVPEAKLDIYYDWTMVRQAQPEFYEALVKKMAEVSASAGGVVHHGGVSHEELHRALKRANVWAYSHFDNPMVETFCISSVKAAAAGAVCLTVPNGALAEICPSADFVLTQEAYEKWLIELLLNPRPIEDRVAAARDAVAEFGWKAVAKRFSDVWTLRSREVAGSEAEPLSAPEPAATVESEDAPNAPEEPKPEAPQEIRPESVGA